MYHCVHFIMHRFTSRWLTHTKFTISWWCSASVVRMCGCTKEKTGAWRGMASEHPAGLLAAGGSGRPVPASLFSKFSVHLENLSWFHFQSLTCKIWYFIKKSIVNNDLCFPLCWLHTYLGLSSSLWLWVFLSTVYSQAWNSHPDNS